MWLSLDIPKIPLYIPGIKVSRVILLTGNHDVHIQEISVILSGHSESDLKEQDE